MQFYYYTTKFKVRWDQLAYAGYGNQYRMEELLEANQNLPVWNWVPVGVQVAFPILLDAATNPANTLPAWKQPI